jgi:hypothetical protein
MPADKTKGTLAALAEVLARLPAEPLHMAIVHGGLEITLDVRPIEMAEAPPLPLRPGGPQLSPSERAILAAATRTPQSAKRLAARLNRPCNSYFRDQLRGLVRREPSLLLHTPDGYRLPAPGKEGTAYAT